MSNNDSALTEGREFELGLSPATLTDIVENKLRYVDLATEDVYERLSAANKRALAHLVKAADILDAVFLKQDHPDNIRAKEILQAEAATGDSTAVNALTLFTAHNGVEGHDMYAPKTVPLRLFKNKEIGPGGGVYPPDITKEELVDYIVAHPEQAASILSNNTVVSRENGRLIAQPYSVVFREEMEGAARELLAAARQTDHAGFAEYLRWQAQALVNDSDPEVMFNADRTWINLEDSPLEFTIARESYEDRLSADAAGDPRVESILKENAIKAKLKDSIGIRVGIVNLDSYEKIAIYRQHLDSFNQQMPLLDQYRLQADDVGQQKMSLVDVDLVSLAGDYAAVRGGLTVAQNLPNSDKLAVQLKMGSRLVFHRQVRQSVDLTLHQKFLDALIDPAQHALYDRDADFLFVVGHEFAHSLGPRATRDGRDKNGSLGKWGAILEENKADITSIIMTDYLVSIRAFTPEQANKIYLTWVADELPTKQPADHEAHRFRSIMQLNYFREKGAVLFEKGGKLSIVPEKMVAVARQMLTEVIGLQLEGNPAKAQAFVDKYAAWNEALQYAADERMKLQPRLYRLLRQPLRDNLLTASR